MNISKLDLNLLVYLYVLLREGSVTRAANQPSITQPAMSNGLKRLRDLFKDPLLVRTSDGMTPTKRALELQPVIRDVLSKLEVILLSYQEWDAQFRSKKNQPVKKGIGIKTDDIGIRFHNQRPFGICANMNSCQAIFAMDGIDNYLKTFCDLITGYASQCRRAQPGQRRLIDRARGW